jgi:thymidylate synthase (FAD)
VKVDLVDWTKDPEDTISRMAAVCYDSDTSPDANQRRIKNLIKVGHLATARFAYATFEVSGISRVTSHQMVRSKHLDFLQESQRYVEQPEHQEVTMPKGMSQPVEALYMEAIIHAQQTYKLLRHYGVKKEDARLVLPEASHTRLYVVGNFQAYLDFLRLRTDKAAQCEIRQVAELIGKQLYLIAPNVFHAYG